jgi:membrane associated rhomboid family serine protease
MNSDPKWLRFLEKHLPWIAVPHLAIIFITLQVLGFLLAFTDPVWISRMALFPASVQMGEWWRLVTFLAIPLSMSPIWILFSLWFLYYIFNTLEGEWGAFKTTLYTLVSIVLTIAFSLMFEYPVFQVSDFTSTLFLAVAALYPEQEIQVYMILPVKMKYLGYLSLAYLGYRLFQGSWMDKAFLLTIYSNYFLFFGPALVGRIRQWKRQRDYRSRL